MQIAMVGAGDNDVTATAQLQVLLGVAEEAAPVSLCFHFPPARHPHWPAYSSFPPKIILATQQLHAFVKSLHIFVTLKCKLHPLAFHTFFISTARCSSGTRLLSRIQSIQSIQSTYSFLPIKSDRPDQTRVYVRILTKSEKFCKKKMLLRT